MARPASAGIARAGRITWLVTAAAVAVAVSVATIMLTAGRSGPRHDTAARAGLASSVCRGPAGAAYVSDTGYDAFSAVDTANCDIIQSYNVDDTEVPGDAGDFNYSSANEGMAIHGNTLYFADTGTSTVAVINTRKLSPANYYNPAEKLIHLGAALFPQDLAVTPDGTQVWVADTGPQTSPGSKSDVSVISTATDKVLATLPLAGDPAKIAFSPSGAQAYVTTSGGLVVYDTATRTVTAVVSGLGDPHGVAVSPDGQTVYVTNTDQGLLEVINASTDTVTATISVGELPWQVIVSANGDTVYVANPDSNSVSVIDAATSTVSGTISLAGDPDTLALTPDGSELWVGLNTAGSVAVLDTSDDSVVGSINLGGDGPQSGDGLEPTSIVLTTTPTPGSGTAAAGPAAAARNRSGR
jgi:YVTN family beta-propeller protein